MKFWSRAVIAAAVVAFATSTVVGNAASTPGAPGTPTNLKASAGDTMVNLSWKAPAGVAPDHYTITRTPGTDTRDVPGAATTSYQWQDLANGTTFTFRVTAVNAVGSSTPSLAASAKPRAIPPGRPTNLGATQTAPGQIRLDWTPPATNGSLPNNTDNSAAIQQYNVTINPGGTRNVVPASTLTYAYSGLADNLTYTFTVSATNNRPLTGAAATVYAPLPAGASIGLQPTAGIPNTAITVTGQLFLKNEAMTLYWDYSTHVAGTVVSDATGAFTKVVKMYAGAKPAVHRLCANVQPRPCATFTLRAAPKPSPIPPSPTDTSSPTPAATAPQASGVRLGGGGISGLDIITRPPFVFLPIIAIIGILGVLLYWLLSRRRQMSAAPAATVVHRATRPDYMAPFPTAGTTPVAPPPAPQASAWDAPIQSTPPYAAPPVQPPPAPATYTPSPYGPPPVPPPPVPPAAPPRSVEWPAPQNPPGAPDEPPDLPQPSD